MEMPESRLEEICLWLQSKQLREELFMKALFISMEETRRASMEYMLYTIKLVEQRRGRFGKLQFSLRRLYAQLKQLPKPFRTKPQ